MRAMAVSTWGQEEIDAAKAVIDSGFTTMGPLVEKFEREYAAYTGTKYCVMVNSGSSANLIMVGAHTLRHGPGTVIVPAVGWSTSYSPFQQYGWKLRFVDIDRETLNYDLNGLWKANEAYDADLILAINILGNPNEFGGFPKKIRVLEDNCESMGAVYGNKRTGAWGVMGSHSTYFAHHICTMEGGMVTTDDEYYYHMLLSLRSHGWTRHLPKQNVFNVEPKPFEFLYPGFNVRPMEIQAALGLEQIKRLPELVKVRRENAKKFPLKTQKEIGESSWFAFPLLSEDRPNLEKQLKARGYDYRPIVSGNFLRQPAIKYYNYEAGPTPNADYIHDHGLMIGNHGVPLDWESLKDVHQ